MMSAVIHQETVIFLMAVLHGIGLTVLYDLLRALRRAVPHGVAAVSCEDFLFWITSGFLTFCFAFRYTDGVIRAYVSAGIALGAVLYHFTVSTVVLKAVARLFTFVADVAAGVFSFWKRILMRLSFGTSRLCRKIRRFLKKTIEFKKKRRYNSDKNGSGEGVSTVTGNKKIRGERCGKKKETSE